MFPPTTFVTKVYECNFLTFNVSIGFSFLRLRLSYNCGIFYGIIAFAGAKSINQSISLLNVISPLRNVYRKHYIQVR